MPHFPQAPFCLSAVFTFLAVLLATRLPASQDEQAVHATAQALADKLAQQQTTGEGQQQTTRAPQIV